MNSSEPAVPEVQVLLSQIVGAIVLRSEPISKPYQMKSPFVVVGPVQTALATFAAP